MAHKLINKTFLLMGFYSARRMKILNDKISRAKISFEPSSQISFATPARLIRSGGDYTNFHG